MIFNGHPKVTEKIKCVADIAAGSALGSNIFEVAHYFQIRSVKFNFVLRE